MNAFDHLDHYAELSVERKALADKKEKLDRIVEQALRPSDYYTEQLVLEAKIKKLDKLMDKELGKALDCKPKRVSIEIILPDECPETARFDQEQYENKVQFNLQSC